MTSFEKKIDVLIKLHGELAEADRGLKMKFAQFDALMKDIATTELGFAADAKEIPLPELLLKAYQKVHM